MQEEGTPVSGARVLLFGASGFLGRHAAAALRADDRTREVVPVGRSRPGWVRHDLTAGSPDELASLLREVRPDAVVNCAGRLTGSAAELVAANVEANARLVDAITDVLPSTRLVVLGSAAEYGVVPEDRPVSEDAPANPVSVYGVSRLAGTQLVRVATTDGGLDGVVLRVFNPIGPGLHGENLLGRAASGIRDALARGVDHVRLGPLGAYRDFVDVRDVATAISSAALADEVPEPVLNVGSGKAVTCRDAVGLLAEAAGFTGEVVESDPPSARSAAVHWIVADLTRTNRALDWSPAVDLRDSVRSVWTG
jgi:nucleoside-diphosphate-sugar epimerase